VTTKSNIKRLVNSLLKKAGFQICRSDQIYSLENALDRTSKKGIGIQSIIDIGASNGSWSQIVKSYYPDASFHLIEANQYHEEKLKQFKETHQNVDYVLAAAGDRVGQIYFDASDPLGGLASHEPLTDKPYITVPVTTIDTEVVTKHLAPPFLLKLDTHGFEMPILKGAEQTLKDTNIIVIETYNFNLTKDSLRFWEMCSFLESKGFRPIDMCDPLYRVRDQSFWQIDFFFIRDNRPEFQVNSYN
jgi:FkbM family methyltransferase